MYLTNQPRSFTSPSSIPTNPFKFTQTSRPLHRTHIYESVVHDESDVVFHDDLRRWQMIRGLVRPTLSEEKVFIPPVPTALLVSGRTRLRTQPRSERRRGAQIEIVDQYQSHYLLCTTCARPWLNAAGAVHSLQSYWVSFDLPVIASCVKLWDVGVESAFGSCMKVNFRRL